MGKLLQGAKTYIVMLISAFIAPYLATHFGIVLTPQQQTELATAFMFVVAAAMRTASTGPALAGVRTLLEARAGKAGAAVAEKTIEELVDVLLPLVMKAVDQRLKVPNQPSATEGAVETKESK